jgi:hypothetical protein
LGGECSPFLVEISRERGSVREDGNRILTGNEALVHEAFGAKLPERLSSGLSSDPGPDPPPEMKTIWVPFCSSAAAGL